MPQLHATNLIFRVFNFSSTRHFSTTTILRVINPHDPNQLDPTPELADRYRNDPTGLEEYYETKKNAIIESLRTDTNSAAANGVPLSEGEE